jgi:integrase
MRNITFEDYANRYLDSVVISYSSQKSYRSIIKLFVNHMPDNKRLKDITPYDMQVLMKKFTETRSPKTVNNRFVLYSSIFQRAMKEKIISENPAEGLSVVVVKDDIVPFTPSEMKNILKTAYEIRPEIAIYFAIAFYTGMRSGEILALTRTDICLRDYKIKVSKTVTEGILKNSTKTNDIRYVDIVPDLDPYIEKHLEFMHNKGYMQELLISQYGKPVRSYNTISRHWEQILGELGIEFRNQYCLRHTFACNMLAAGEDPAWVSAMLGHKSLKMTLDTYGRWVVRRSGRAGRRFSQYMLTEC